MKSEAALSVLDFSSYKAAYVLWLQKAMVIRDHQNMLAYPNDVLYERYRFFAKFWAKRL